MRGRPCARTAVDQAPLPRPLRRRGVRARVPPEPEQSAHLLLGHHPGHDRLGPLTGQRAKSGAEPDARRLALLPVVLAERARPATRVVGGRVPAASGTYTRRRPRAWAGSSPADRDTLLCHLGRKMILRSKCTRCVAPTVEVTTGACSRGVYGRERRDCACSCRRPLVRSCRNESRRWLCAVACRHSGCVARAVVPDVLRAFVRDPRRPHRAGHRQLRRAPCSIAPEQASVGASQTVI
jgi:hypothetical protein